MTNNLLALWDWEYRFWVRLRRSRLLARITFPVFQYRVSNWCSTLNELLSDSEAGSWSEEDFQQLERAFGQALDLATKKR